MKLLKRKKPVLCFQQNKHLTLTKGFHGTLVGGFNHPTFTDVWQIGSFPHVKVKHQKKSPPLATLTSHNFTQTLLRDTHLHLSQDAGQRQI